MDRLIIRGGKRLEGSVQIRGAKNAVLPQIAAALLSSAPLEITNVPDVSDVTTMLALLQEFGVATQRDARSVTIDAGKAANAVARYDLVRKMRAGILVLGPLVARFGSARVSLPGGCAIGARPVDLHLKVLEALGADGRRRGRLHQCECQRRQAEGRTHRAAAAVNGGDRNCVDGRDPGARRDRNSQRGARAGDCRSRTLPRRDGRQDRRRRYASHAGAGRRRHCAAPPTTFSPTASRPAPMRSLPRSPAGISNCSMHGSSISPPSARRSSAPACRSGRPIAA